MTAFDTDIFTEVVFRNAVYLQRASQVPQVDRCLPIVVIEEAVRGRLDSIRRAQPNQGRVRLSQAYNLFRDTLEDLRQYRILDYTPAADALFRQWRTSIRIGTNDLRISAICVDHGAKLVTRNARDFAQVPGLNLEVWN